MVLYLKSAQLGSRLAKQTLPQVQQSGHRKYKVQRREIVGFGIIYHVKVTWLRGYVNVILMS